MKNVIRRNKKKRTIGYVVYLLDVGWRTGEEEDGGDYHLTLIYGGASQDEFDSFLD